MIELGILLALASALGVNVSMLCKHRGAVAAPDVRISRPRADALGIVLRSVAFVVVIVATALMPAGLGRVPSPGVAPANA